MDWFLYDNGLHHERVKINSRTFVLYVKAPEHEFLFFLNLLKFQIFRKYFKHATRIIIFL